MPEGFKRRIPRAHHEKGGVASVLFKPSDLLHGLFDRKHELFRKTLLFAADVQTSVILGIDFLCYVYINEH